MRFAAASSTLYGSESRRASNFEAGRTFCAVKWTSTAGSLTIFLTCSRNATGSSSGSARTSSVALASDGITFER